MIVLKILALAFTSFFFFIWYDINYTPANFWYDDETTFIN